MKHPEFNLQTQVCAYLNVQYPHVQYMSDTVASVKLTMPQAVRNKKIQKKGFKCPDLIIFQPKGKYNGLLIELKVISPFTKSGKLKKNEHILAQSKTIIDLREKGYFATFATGFEDAKNVIDAYMNEKRLCDCWLNVGRCKCEE